MLKMDKVCSCKKCSYECCDVVMVKGPPGPPGPPGPVGPPGAQVENVRAVLVTEIGTTEVEIPEGFDLVDITVVGGGGVGSQAVQDQTEGGGGGGSGDKVSTFLVIDPVVTTITVELGAGGVVGTPDGGTSTVTYGSTNLVAVGGSGAADNNGGAGGGTHGLPGQDGSSATDGGDGGDGGGLFGGAGGVASSGTEEEREGKPGSMGSGGGGGAWIDTNYYVGGNGGDGYAVFKFYKTSP